MPFQSIPTSYYHFVIGGTSPPPTSIGQSVSALWPLSVDYPPQPIERFWLSSFYLPMAILTVGPGTQPSVAAVTAQLFLSGALCFQNQININLYPLGATSGNWVIGSGSANVTVNQPVQFDSGQTLQLGFQAQLDQLVGDLTVYISTTIEGLNLTSPSLGSIGYSAERVDVLFA